MYKGLSFELPDELIAQAPVEPRDSARLLVYNRQTKEITDDVFYNLDQHLTDETTIVLNNAKVDKCRWLFDGGRTEVFVLDKLDDRRILAMVRPGKRFKQGAVIELAEGISAEVQDINSSGQRVLKLNLNHDDPRLASFEHIPLPPYIAQDDSLADDYQTIYAHDPGSKAAPTAGLHFTEDLLKRLLIDHIVVELSLRVGLGTFAPLEEANFKSRKLHQEDYKIEPLELGKLSRASHVTAVGTTSLRTLESLPERSGLDITEPISASTDIFITPGYKFKNVDSLITNFHLPGTSLLLLIEAFIGDQAETERIYKHAINNQYRFYSFGDAMLII